MANPINNRHEIVYVYDVKDGNPNGDPMDENKPRMDEETGINIVTDVRLKRTTRDELMEQGKEVFINGKAITAKKRAEEALEKDPTKLDIKERDKVKKELFDKFIDLRLFGGTILFNDESKQRTNEVDSKKKKGKKIKDISCTGPIQFRFGRSLHKVDNTI